MFTLILWDPTPWKAKFPLSDPNKAAAEAAPLPALPPTLPKHGVVPPGGIQSREFPAWKSRPTAHSSNLSSAAAHTCVINENQIWQNELPLVAFACPLGNLQSSAGHHRILSPSDTRALAVVVTSPTPLLSALHPYSKSRWCHGPHFTLEYAEAQRQEGTCPGSHS